MTKVVNKNISILLSEFIEVRKLTENLFKSLNAEDAVIQSDPFGSPPNWHISHVTWFFHQILRKYGKDISIDKINLNYLNSYYQKFEKILPKNERGKFPRPTISESLLYRETVDKNILTFLEEIDDLNPMLSEIIYDIQLGNQHEMQHQELMVYDFQNYFERFPDPYDNYKPFKIHGSSEFVSKGNIEEMISIPGGIYNLGFSGDAFSYDNELPEHKVYLYPYKIDATPVSNGDFMKFIDDGGYKNYKFWLSDGWDLVQEFKWEAPLYWSKRDGIWIKKDFFGLNPIQLEEPVINVSYYEADAYAKWARKRLPTEAEWEKAASWNEDSNRKSLYPWGDYPPTSENSNLLDSFLWKPSICGSYENGRSFYGCYQMIGDVWEWTCSEYSLYPGFKSKFSEYTDKWAINQKVLRGGSFATPKNQIRNSYRNYFKPHERILFAGFRCVK
ncbi:MAG: ergothioneine biosynthesis protein EgtB [Nitrososphaeraceae archaeon]|nr:ergothioneine biosynthesis protein EgtB [Nitrososphaeraceae archaeon]